MPFSGSFAGFRDDRLNLWLTRTPTEIPARRHCISKIPVTSAQFLSKNREHFLWVMLEQMFKQHGSGCHSHVRIRRHAKLTRYAPNPFRILLDVLADDNRRRPPAC